MLEKSLANLFSPIKALVFIGNLLFFSCSNPSGSELRIIEIPKRTNPDINLSEIAHSINIIPLETTEDALISNIYDVKLFDKRIYVKDRTKQILVFDAEGNFIRKLIPSGDGPGELKTITTFTIDEESGKIYISGRRKLLAYSDKDGFLEEKSFPIDLSYLTVLGDKLFAIAEFNMNPVESGFSNETVLFELDPQLEIIDSLSLRHVTLDQKMILGFHNRNFISRVGGQNYVYTPVPPKDKFFRDTLYQIKENRLLPFIKLNFESPHFDGSGHKAIMILNIFLAKDYLICEYEIENKRRVFLYDQKNTKGYNLDEGFLDEQGDRVVLRPLDLTNNVFYYTKSMEFSDSFTEELNPVLGIVKLKTKD